MSTTHTPARVFHFPVGDGKGAAFAIPHNLNNQFPVVQVYRAAAPFSQVAVAIEATSQDEVTLHFASPPQPGEYIVVIIG